MSTTPPVDPPVRSALVWVDDDAVRSAVTTRLLSDGFHVTAPGDRAAEQVPAPGPLDLLVAAVTEPGEVLSLEADAGAWLRTVSSALHEPFGLVRDALPKLRAGTNSRVIFLGRGWSAAQSGETASAALNGGLIALMKTLARDLGPEGISVNAIAVPVGATGTGDSVARAVSYLAGPHSSSVIGQVLTIGALSELRP